MKKVILTAIIGLILLSGCGENFIGKEMAKKIALGHAGVPADKVLSVQVELDRDLKRSVYEVSIHTEGLEIEYEIDAKTGNVVSCDTDVEDFLP